MFAGQTLTYRAQNQPFGQLGAQKSELDREHGLTASGQSLECLIADKTLLGWQQPFGHSGA